MLEVELAKEASESEVRHSQNDDKPTWKHYVRMAMESANSPAEFQRMCWNVVGVPMPAMPSETRTWSTLLAPVLVRSTVTMMRKSLRSSVAEAFRYRESQWGRVAHLPRVLLLLVNKLQERSSAESRVLAFNNFVNALGIKHSVSAESSVSKECVPPLCASHASHVANLVAADTRCVDFSMCSGDEVGESAKNSVPSVVGDSLSLFSP